MLNNYNLKRKQELFCLHYLSSYNATQAYLKAYGCSYRVANINGSRLLKETNIKRYLADLKQEQSRIIGLTVNDVLLRCAKLAFANIGDYVNIERVEESLTDKNNIPLYDVNNKPITKISNIVWLNDSDSVDMSLISEIRVNKDGIAVKLKDSSTALGILMNYLPEQSNQEQTGVNTFIQALQLSESLLKESKQRNDPEQKAVANSD